MTEKSIEDLKWVRAFSSDIVPKFLIEQIKNKDFTVEDFYKYQNINCLIPGKNGPTLNPLNHLYVLADSENIVKGVLWFVVDPLSKCLVVNSYSVDKEYWGKGAIQKAATMLKEIKSKANIAKVYWVTNYPKAFEKQGFKRSKNTIMEFIGEENG